MSKLARKLFIGGNWKCNNTLEQTQQLMTNVVNKMKFDNSKMDVLIAPTFVHIPEVTKMLSNNSVLVSAQNVSKYGFGAYTGETSLHHLKDFNINWTLTGHSERRHTFNEDNNLVAEKTALALENQVNVVLCIGETLEERKGGNMLNVVQEQLNVVKQQVKDKSQWNNIVIAYEPVWAIGTGEVATPEQAQEVHAFIREWLGKNLGDEYQNSVRIVYGGSVKETNCEKLIKEKDIDGFLIGGAALKESFKNIVDIVSESM